MFYVICNQKKQKTGKGCCSNGRGGVSQRFFLGSLGREVFFRPKGDPKEISASFCFINESCYSEGSVELK